MKAIQSILNYLRAWKLRLSTEREIELEARLKAERERAVAAGNRYKVLEGDFEALWDDHEALKVAYAQRVAYSNIAAAREEDWSPAESQRPRAKWISCGKCSHKFGQIEMPDGSWRDVGPCEHVMVPGATFFIEAEARGLARRA